MHNVRQKPCSRRFLAVQSWEPPRCPSIVGWVGESGCVPSEVYSQQGRTCWPSPGHGRMPDMGLPKATSYRKATSSSCHPVIWAQKGAKLKCARTGSLP